MYRTIIKLKKDIAPEQLPMLTKTVVDNFNNRAGKVENHSNDPYEFVFEGEGEPAFECLDLGVAMLARTQFLDYVSSWDWVDEEEPFENCDIYQLYMARRIKNAKKANSI